MVSNLHLSLLVRKMFAQGPLMADRQHQPTTLTRYYQEASPNLVLVVEEATNPVEQSINYFIAVGVYSSRNVFLTWTGFVTEMT